MAGTLKKSDSIEVRLPHATKQAFMDRCRAQGRTASEAVRGFVEEMVAGTPRRSGSLVRSLGAGIVLAAVAAIVWSMSARWHAPRAHFLTEFAAMDADRDGALTRAEYDGAEHAARRRFGEEQTPLLLLPIADAHGVRRGFAVDVAHSRFERVDLDRSGTITPAEYQLHRLEAVRRGFERLDADRNGLIDRDEYAAVRRIRFLNDPPAIASFDALDGNRDGQVRFDEFVG
ncbi:MAG: hypothetical protein ACOY45_06670 [Pseudomonadota bacterium]